MKRMKKEELWNLAEKIGIKKENFELGYKENKEALESQICKVAEHMGFYEESEEDTEEGKKIKT